VDGARRCGLCYTVGRHSLGPVRTRPYYLHDYLRAPRTGPLFYPCVLGYSGQVSLSLLPAAEPRPLEVILVALLCKLLAGPYRRAAAPRRLVP
jgi:hypothetical protein